MKNRRQDRVHTFVKSKCVSCSCVTVSLWHPVRGACSEHRYWTCSHSKHLHQDRRVHNLAAERAHASQPWLLFYEVTDVSHTTAKLVASKWARHVIHSTASLLRSKLALWCGTSRSKLLCPAYTSTTGVGAMKVPPNEQSDTLTDCHHQNTAV